jgi:hypothetical protein
MRIAIACSALALIAMSHDVSAQGPAKPKPSLQDDAKALQGTWDRPPTMAPDGKLIHGLRLEVRGTQFTAVIYAKSGDPRGGEHTVIGRPFSLKEEGSKRLIHDEGNDVPVFVYQLQGEQLTLISEKFIIARLGTDWNVPTRNVLTQLPDKQGAEKERAAKEPALRKELLAMEKEDQEIRAAVFKALGEKGISPVDGKPITDPALMKTFLEQTGKMTAVDRKNRERLQTIVDKHGWPGRSLVGIDGAHAAWLLVQHADADPAFQKRCLDLMKAAPVGEADAKDIAYLTDRVLVRQKKKQLYGTQLVGQGDKFIPQPIEDEAYVDRRRAEVGLPPLAEYLKTSRSVYDKLSGKKNEKK